MTTLATRSLLYRRPDLYDNLRTDPTHTTAQLCRELIATHGQGDAKTVLDLGCGTGSDLAGLAEWFTCVGVDVQPQMVAYANQTRPHLDIRVGDIRTFRLNYTVDAVLCLGNALAYLYTDHDIQAAFTTFAAHARPRSLLILCTQIAPVETDGPATQRMNAGHLQADVAIRYEWDARTRINTLHRHWRLDDGTEHHDAIQRRVLRPRELERHAQVVGYEPLELFSDPQDRAAPLTSTSWLVARNPG